MPHYRIPATLKAEHDELHAELARATQAGGKTSRAAEAVVRIMHPHFVKEEEYALPPLGLLTDLAAGKFEPGMATVLRLTDKLEAEMPQMLAEHKEIVAALNRLIEVAKAESNPSVVAFAANLIAHARAEEEVAYPAALLVGRYIKARRDADEGKKA